MGTQRSAREIANEEIELVGGQRVRAYRAAQSEAPLVLIAPALGLRADYYAPLCEALTQAGMHAVAIDLPGHGQSPLRASRELDWGYLEALDHLARARARLCAHFARTGCVWLGHSIGGQLALMDAGRSPECVSAVLLVASGSPYFRAWDGVAAFRILTGTSVAAVAARALGYLPGEQLGFGGREARSLIAEWAQLSRSGRYACAGFDAEALLSECKVPVLALRLVGDPLAPERAVEQTLRKLGSQDIVRMALEPSDLRNIHNRWPRTPAPVVAALTPFVQRYVLSAAPLPQTGAPLPGDA